MKSKLGKIISDLVIAMRDSYILTLFVMVPLVIWPFIVALAW